METMADMERLIKSEDYRRALHLPDDVTEVYEPLAQGEYNQNYTFVHPVTGETLILRVNCGSQMHLEDQIGYEYRALQLLSSSGRTPKPLYVDGSFRYFDHGILVMEFLPGQELDYLTDLSDAAACLADIHSVPVGEKSGLLSPVYPLQAILDECEDMFRIYAESPLGSTTTKGRIRRMLDVMEEKVNQIQMEIPYRCCINTELNSTNFLIDQEKDTCALIDWEKPLYGDPAQDLGHFLAPTTTFWKTDVILSESERAAFLDQYIQDVKGRFDVSGLWGRTNLYIPVTCMRGITWCAMAWVQYQDPDKEIVNVSTAEKLDAYLSDDFLSYIEGIVGLR